MNLLYPRFSLRLLPAMLLLAVLGGLAGGLYGILHDQVTYTISPEYFTRLKFEQFAWADVGLPPRVLAAEVGFLATWWVGFFAAWFLARVVVPAWPGPEARRRCLQGVGIILAAALAAGLIGGVLGLLHTDDYSHWQDLCDERGVTDVRAFVTVAYIHNASYLGGVAGLVAAILFLRRARARRGVDAPAIMAAA